MDKRSRDAYYSFLLDRKLGENLSVQMYSSYSFADDQNKGKSDSYLSGMTGLPPRITTDNSEQAKGRQFIVAPRLKYTINKEKGTALHTNPTYAFVSRYEDNVYEDSENASPTPTNASVLDAGTEIYFVDLIVDHLINNKVLQTEFGYKHFPEKHTKERGKF